MSEQTERNVEVQAFIAKDVGRYYAIFKKNRDKKIFIHTNWAAFFFGPIWMFYRSMWLWGSLAFILEYILEFFVAFLLTFLYLPAIIVAGYVSSSVEMNIVLGTYVVLLLARLAFSLFADCIYCAYIRKNVGIKEGGTSIAGVIVGAIVGGFVSNSLATIISIIAVILTG